MTYPGRITAGVQFAMARDFIELAPADVVRRAAAQRAGALLTELLLNPEADPFTDLKLRAEQLVPDFLTDSVSVRIQLSCATMPERYTPRPPEYVASKPRGELE